MTKSSYKGFIPMIMRRGHLSMFEHEKVTMRFICDRGVTHEIVRHRIAAYSMESTRYCNYGTEKFGNGITVIRPYFFPEGSDVYKAWEEAMSKDNDQYLRLLDLGASAQEARSVLPNSLKTEIVVTYNLREWRHFFKLRAAKEAHPQMQQVVIPLLLFFKEKFAPLYDDIDYNHDFDPADYALVYVVDGPIIDEENL